MAINYSCKVTKLEMAPELNGLTNVITRVRFTYTGEDTVSGYSGSFQGAVPMPAPSSGSFTDLNNLTEEQVVQWVLANHPTDHMQQQIEKQINLQIKPKYQEVELPWAPAPSGSSAQPSGSL